MNARALALLAAGALALGACSDKAEPFAMAPEAAVQTPQARDPIAKIAIENGSFTQLVAALQYVDEAPVNAGLVNLFLANNSGPFTVFAPTDAAFGRLYATLSAVLKTEITNIRQVERPVVLEVLKYHVVAGRLPSPTVLPKSGTKALSTLQGESFWVTSAGMIQDGLGNAPRTAIVTPDVKATNGVIHVIDEVLLPPTLVRALTSAN